MSVRVFVKIRKPDLLYEPITGRYLECMHNEFVRCVYNFNHKREDDVTKRLSLNTWLEEIGLSRIELGDDLVWPSWKEIGALDIQYERRLRDNGNTVSMIMYKNNPIFEFK